MFTQPTGPNIDISLFGDATRSGIEAGNALPTALTSGIRGAIQGVQQGQDIAIRQNQINQQPVQNARQSEALKQDQIKSQEDALALDTAEKNHVALQEAQLAKAKLENQQATSAADDAKYREEVGLQLASTDPNERAKIFTDPRLAAKTQTYGLEHPQFSEGLFSKFINDPEQSPEVKQTVKGMQDYTVAQNLATARARADAMYNKTVGAGYGSAMEDMAKDGNITKYFVGMPLSKINNDITTTPEGQYSSIEGKRIPGPGVDPGTLGTVTNFDIWKGDTKIGTWPAAQDAKFHKAMDAYSRLYGTSAAPQRGPESVINPTPPGQKVELSSQIQNPFQGGAPSQGQGPTPIVQNTELHAPVTNENIVAQRAAQLKEVAKNPPPGIASGAGEDAAIKMKKYITQKYQSPNASQVQIQGGGHGGGGGGETNMGVPIQPKSADEALSSAVGKPVTLKTDVSFKVPTASWNNVNSNPVLSSEGALVKGLATIESGGNENALSPTGVKGLLQVTQAVANQYGLDRTNPASNVLAGKKYLYDTLTTFDGDLRLALTAYNAGPGVIKEAVNAAGTTDWTAVKSELQKILSPTKFKEAVNYADKVISASSHYVQKGNDSDNYFLYLLHQNGLIST